jgi:hypothetical protein
MHQRLYANLDKACGILSRQGCTDLMHKVSQRQDPAQHKILTVFRIFMRRNVCFLSNLLYTL